MTDVAEDFLVEFSPIFEIIDFAIKKATQISTWIRSNDDELELLIKTANRMDDRTNDPEIVLMPCLIISRFDCNRSTGINFSLHFADMLFAIESIYGNRMAICVDCGNVPEVYNVICRRVKYTRLVRRNRPPLHISYCRYPQETPQFLFQ